MCGPVCEPSFAEQCAAQRARVERDAPPPPTAHCTAVWAMGRVAVAVWLLTRGTWGYGTCVAARNTDVTPSHVSREIVFARPVSRGGVKAQKALDVDSSAPAGHRLSAGGLSLWRLAAAAAQPQLRQPRPEGLGRDWPLAVPHTLPTPRQPHCSALSTSRNILKRERCGAYRKVEKRCVTGGV